MSERVKPPDVIWLQYCKDGSLGQFWWAAGDAEYIRRNSINYCTPEERAVIDEAISEFLHSKDLYWNRPRGHSFTSADGSLRDRVEQLLVIRSKSEVSK